MCTMSMIVDHQHDWWLRRYEQMLPYVGPVPPSQTIMVQPMVTPEEIAEFRDLLERARKYDREHGQPDCELAEKKQKLKDLAELMGVDISFVDEAVDA